MTDSPRSITRRALLRGGGAVVSLPWLESIARALPRGIAAAPARRALRADGSIAPAVRFVALYMPNGVWSPDWTPAGAGREFELSRTLAPLAPVKDDVLILSGLRNENSRDGDGHYAKTAPWLTGAAIRRTGGRDLMNGVSMDQVAARALDGCTPLPSLELGCEPVRPVEDMGYSTVYGGHVSWRSPTTPCTKEIVPRLVFDRLFRSARLREGGSERSVLDVVAGDARRLDARLARADRAKLSEYLDSVRELEKRIDRCSDDAPGHALDPALRPQPGIPRSHGEHADLMLDLIVLALRADVTRVVTFMYGNAVSNADMGFLDGVKGGHHEYSHHEEKPEKSGPYQLINRWHVETFARLVAKLKAIDEEGVPLLHRSLLLFGSALRDGNSHSASDLPTLLAGRGAGVLPPLESGRHLRFPDPTPLCNLHLSLLRRMGVEAERFGDSTGDLLA
jgi:hypothetical protein